MNLSDFEKRVLNALIQGDSLERTIREQIEEKYDNEVISCLKKYGKIRKAINRANKKYPGEALEYNEENIGEIEAHYDYLMKHIEIINRVAH